MVDELNLKRDKSKAQLIQFLQTQSLAFEEVDTCFVIKHNHQIIACASKLHNVFKMIAVSCHFQSQDLVAKLVSALIERCHEEGIYHYYIFTKMIYLTHFETLGFKLVASYDSIGLFEMGNFSFNKQLDLFKSQLTMQGSKGAILMNANPFTLGHLYLVEYACQQVDHLIVFVVEQEESYFDFLARIEMVCQGCSHLDNVTVVPSGPYMISQATFPTYFLKRLDDKNEYYMNLDIAIFERFMMELDICVRFVGSEPVDKLTSMYNHYLQERLGDRLVMIDRLVSHQTVISATRVRNYYMQGDFESLKKLVPLTTYDYLHNLYSLK